MGQAYATESTPAEVNAEQPNKAPRPRSVEPQGALAEEAVLAPSSDGVDTKTGHDALKGAIDAYSTAVFNDLDAALKSTIAALKLPKKPPEPSLAAELIAGLVATLGEIAFNYFTAGVVGVVGRTITHKAAEAVDRAAEQVAIKVGRAVEGRVSKYLENEPAREKEEKKRRESDQAKDESSDPGESHMMNLAATDLIGEFEFRQQHSLNWARAEARVFQLTGALDKATNAQLLGLANALHANKGNNDRIGSFEKQITFGWMNFCTRASMEKDLDQGRSVSNAMQSRPLDHDQPALHAEGGIDVIVDVPTVVRGAAGLSLKAMSADTGPGTATVLRNSNGLLMRSPVLRRIWLQKGEGVLQQSCVIVLYPNGGMDVKLEDEVLAAIGGVSAAPRDGGAMHSKVLAQVGAQLLLGWLQPLRLGALT